MSNNHTYDNQIEFVETKFSVFEDFNQPSTSIPQPQQQQQQPSIKSTIKMDSTLKEFVLLPEIPLSQLQIPECESEASSCTLSKNSILYEPVIMNAIEPEIKVEPLPILNYIEEYNSLSEEDNKDEVNVDNEKCNVVKNDHLLSDNKIEQAEQPLPVQPKKPPPKRRKPSKRRRKSVVKQKICSICGILTKHLTQHMVSHTNTKPYTCDYCKISVKTLESLRKHMKYHTNVRPHNCPQCEVTFKTTTHLKRHMVTHTRERNFPCDLCDKAFYDAGTRNMHRITHAQIRKHACPHCGKLFLKSIGLKNHIGIHTGERPFACGLCPMRFVNSSGASVHRRTTHFKDSTILKCEECNIDFLYLHLYKSHMETHNFSKFAESNSSMLSEYQIQYDGNMLKQN